jgi:hypothetical protein
MTKFACLGSALALFAGCGFLGFGRGDDDAKPAAKPADERIEERAKAPQPAPEGEAPVPREPEYVPPDFPAPWTDTEQAFRGDFWQGKELLGFDPYRSPDATGGNRGYYFGYPAVVVVKKEKEEDK